jgi:alkylation response protein AidB-like acyl-CoA dehydrogenase
MKFSFDDDQLAFRDAVRDALAKECPPAAVRQPTRVAWDTLAEMGVQGILVPESRGGLGLDERWLVLPLEEAGYAALPQPIVETAAVAMPLAAGHVAASAILSTDLGGPIVPYATEASHLVLADGPEAMVLIAGGDGVIEPVTTVDPARAAGRARFDRATATPLTGDRDLAFNRGAWGTAAFLIGLSQRMLDITVDYVTKREQFGVPVGSFQAVKHHLADAALQLAFARPAVYQAAWSLASGNEQRGRDVSLAKALASGAAGVVGRQALQCHGAIGYTVEADLQLFLKRSWALMRAWGDAAWHRDRIGRALDV